MNGPEETRVAEEVVSEVEGVTMGVFVADESLVAASASNCRPESDGVNRGRVDETVVTVGRPAE